MARGPQGAAGYSGTPLPEKLGLKPGHQVALIDEPPELRELLGELPADIELRATLGSEPDVVMLFQTEASALQDRLPAAAEAIFPAGAIWVAWPKRASKVETDVTEDTVREVGLPMGLVDNKVCAISDVWSGLRLVWRRERRGPENARGPDPEGPGPRRDETEGAG